MSMRVAGAAFALALGASACSIDDDSFEPTPLGRLVVTPGVVAVTEGQDSSFAIHIDTPPAGPTIVNCASGDGTLLASTPTLVFDEATAGVDQIVTLSAIQDMNLFDSFTTVTCSSGDLEPGVVNVNVLDDDVQQIRTSPSPGAPIEIGEGQSMNIQVWLAFQDVTTRIDAARVGTEINVAPTLLQLTSNDYNVPHNILLAGLTDADTTDDMDTIVLSSPGAAPVSLSVLVVDAN